MSTHTKRSPEFQNEIDTLIGRICALVPVGCMSPELSERICEILGKHTTDNGCMVKAADDEPIFVLRGQDITSWKAIHAWIEENATKNYHFVDSQKHLDASACATAMLNYPMERQKLAD